MTGTAPERFKMETNFEGLIKLLAEHLYSEPDVFVRELVQNASDSIVRRRRAEPDLAGRIEIDIDPASRTLVSPVRALLPDRAKSRTPSTSVCSVEVCPTPVRSSIAQSAIAA